MLIVCCQVVNPGHDDGYARTGKTNIGLSEALMKRSAMKVIEVAVKIPAKKPLTLLMVLFLSGCSIIPDLPGPIGIPGF